MTNPQNSGRNRRSLFNIRLVKGTQLRIVFGLMTAGMLLSAAMVLNVVRVVNVSLGKAPVTDPALLNFFEEIREAVTSALWVGLIFIACAALISLLFGLMISHRFYGPVVPLARHLNELREGKFGARVKLRPGDELAELMDAQNALAEALEKRN